MAADQLRHSRVSMTQDNDFGRGRVHDLVADIIDQTIGASALPVGVPTETGGKAVG